MLRGDEWKERKGQEVQGQKTTISELEREKETESERKARIDVETRWQKVDEREGWRRRQGDMQGK